MDAGLFSIQFQQSLWSGLSMGSIYALIGMGFTLMFHARKIINIAQGEFIMVGALSLYSFISTFHLPYPIAVLLVFFVMAAIGLIMYFLSINLVKKGSILTYALVTIAFGEIIKGVGLLIWKSDPYSIPTMIEQKSVQIFSASINPQVFLIFGAVLIIYVVLKLVNNYTMFGKSFSAISEDDYAASLVGINVKKYTIIALMISAMIGGIAGILVGPVTSMGYDYGTMLGISALTAALLGGLGSYEGSIIGGLALGLLESFSAGFISSYLKDIIAFSVLIIILYYSPTGIMGLLRKRMQ